MCFDYDITCVATHRYSDSLQLMLQELFELSQIKVSLEKVEFLPFISVQQGDRKTSEKYTVIFF